MTLGEKERLLKEVEKERELWRQRDRAVSSVLKEKEAVILCLKAELESCRKAASGSGDGQAAQLTELWEERERNSATLCQEVTKLTSTLQEYQELVQVRESEIVKRKLKKNAKIFSIAE